MTKDDGFIYVLGGQMRMSGNLNPLWLDSSFDPKRSGYASIPVTSIAWKPIVD